MDCPAEHLCPALDYLTGFRKHHSKLQTRGERQPLFLQDLPEADNMGMWAMGKQFMF